MRWIIIFMFMFTVVGCGSENGSENESEKPADTDQPSDDTLDQVSVDVVEELPEPVTLHLVADNNLNGPSDLKFNPDSPLELWVANRSDDALSVIIDVDADSPQVKEFFSTGHHFLHKVIALSFGDAGTLGTIGESENEPDPANPDFMGPVLWPSQLSTFLANMSAVDNLHLDMLHETQLGVGIAAAGGNTFYVFNGQLGVIDWYDFKEPHEPGGSDHSDGLKRRYIDVGVTRVPLVPGHMEYDADSGYLYIADTGNSRIIRLDTATGSAVGEQRHWGDEKPITLISGATVEEIVTQGSGLLEVPSGLDLHDGLLYITDNETSVITIFDLAGTVVETLITGLPKGSLAGIAVRDNGDIYLVNRFEDAVLRIDHSE